MDVPDRGEFEDLRNHANHFAMWSAVCVSASMFWAHWQIYGRERLRDADSVRALRVEVDELYFDLASVGVWSGPGATPPSHMEFDMLAKQAAAFQSVLQTVRDEVERALRLLNDEGAGAQD